MNINTDTMISMTEANQNFSKVARLVDEKGSAVILKNNAPRYLVIDFQQVDRNEALSDADVLAVSRKLMEETRCWQNDPPDKAAGASDAHGTHQCDWRQLWCSR